MIYVLDISKLIQDLDTSHYSIINSYSINNSSESYFSRFKNRHNYDNFTNTLKNTIKGLNNSINVSGVMINYNTIAEDILQAIKNNNGNVKLNNELLDLANIRSQSNLFIENDIIRFTNGVIYDRIFRIPDYNPKENFDIALYIGK